MAFKAGHAKVGGKKKLSATESAELLRRTAQRAGPKVIRKLVQIVGKSNEDSDVIAAGRILLERGYGRAAEPEPAPAEQKMSIEEANHKINEHLRQMLGPELFEQYEARKTTTASGLHTIGPGKPIEQPKVIPEPTKPEKPKTGPPKDQEQTVDSANNRWKM